MNASYFDTHIFYEYGINKLKWRKWELRTDMKFGIVKHALVLDIGFLKPWSRETIFKRFSNVWLRSPVNGRPIIQNPQEIANVCFLLYFLTYNVIISKEKSRQVFVKVKVIFFLWEIMSIWARKGKLALNSKTVWAFKKW